MSFQLPLDQMTTAEKLEAMEMICVDLSKNAGKLPLPAWHAEILKECQRDLNEGTAELMDLDEAFAQLRNKVRANPNHRAGAPAS